MLQIYSRFYARLEIKKYIFSGELWQGGVCCSCINLPLFASLGTPTHLVPQTQYFVVSYWYDFS